MVPFSGEAALIFCFSCNGRLSFIATCVPIWHPLAKGNVLIVCGLYLGGMLVVFWLLVAWEHLNLF